MVKIRKGSLTLTVPTGAYKSMYASAGWVVVDDNEPKKNKPEPKQNEVEEEEVEEADTSEELEEEDDVEYEEIEVDPKDLLDKPLDDLDFEELKILAEYLGIETKGVTSSKNLRAAIRKARKDK